jgi:hypothetical protein
MALHMNGVASASKTPSSLDALSDTAKNVNKASRRLTEAVDQVNAALKKLNLGIPVWIPTWSGPDIPGQVQETEEIGYAKVKGKWGVCIRLTVEHAGPDPDVTEWHFEDAPRDMRICGAEFLQKLILAINEQGEKAAKEIDKQATDIESLATTLNEVAEKSKVRASLLPKKENA